MVSPSHASSGEGPFCFAVEMSQLYHAPWIDAIRDTRLGGLVLGHGFHERDLVCYGAGVLLGVLIERVCWKPSERVSART